MNSLANLLAWISNAITYGFARIGAAIIGAKSKIVWLILLAGGLLFPYFGAAIVFSVFCWAYWNHWQREKTWERPWWRK